MKTSKLNDKQLVKIGRELWSVGLERKVEVEKYDARSKWNQLSQGNHEAWKQVARFVIEHGFCAPK